VAGSPFLYTRYLHVFSTQSSLSSGNPSSDPIPAIVKSLFKLAVKSTPFTVPGTVRLPIGDWYGSSNLIDSTSSKLISINVVVASFAFLIVSSSYFSAQPLTENIRVIIRNNNVIFFILTNLYLVFAIFFFTLFFHLWEAFFCTDHTY
jgi:hypothetical protein